MPEDRVVDAHDGIPIAVRDHHGEGPDLVLLHGAGGHLLSLFNLVRKLGDGFRIVSMDARWSGQSGDSEPYDWGDLVRDVEAVTGQVGLSNPIVGGHSWGGIIAAYYGAAHPEAPAVVNLDGHGNGGPSLYDGLSEDDVARAVALMQAANDPPGAGSNEGDDAWHEAARVESRSMTELMGVPAAMVDEWTDRNFVRLATGRWRRHPSPTLFAGLRGDLDLFSLYPTIECPLQVFNCTAPEPGVPPELQDVLTAYRRGLARALAELAAARPNVDIVTLPDMTHNGVLARGATAAAAEIRRFLGAAGVE